MDKIQELMKASRDKPLTISEFMEEMKYDVKGYTLIKNWHSFDRNLPILVDYDILNDLGYSCEENYNIINSFKKLLKSCDIPYKLYTYNQCIEDNDIIPKPDKVVNKQYLIMEIDDFKEAVCCVKSSIGKQTRKYLLKMERILKDYYAYQRGFAETKRSEERKIRDSETKIYTQKLDVYIKQNKEYIKKTDEYLKLIKKYQKENEEYTKELRILNKKISGK